MEKKQQTKIDLVEFQLRLNESLDAMHSLGDLSSLLGFVSAGKKWLINLADLHEIGSVPSQEKTQRLALAKTWVWGISNFKGNIYTLVDFQMFLGQTVTPGGMNARSLLLHSKHHVQTALIVGEVSGLISTAEIRRVKAGGDWKWVEGQYESTDNTDTKLWNMIDVSLLTSDKEMINIAA